MLIFKKVEEIKKYLRPQQQAGKTIGFVPTMGYLHEGHLSLMRKAREECDLVVVSIFVNPIQFGPGEDYDRYPRDLERDRKLAEEVGVDVLFVPDKEELYPPDYATYVEVERVSEGMCGASRPGHFRGVATVVTKLFNIIRPDRAYFGQKDAQQAVVIMQMVRDLNMDVEIRVLPVVREADGLAMSSRNVYLKGEERQAALILYRTLTEAVELVRRGEKDPEKVRQFMADRVAAEPMARLDYAEVRQWPTLTVPTKLEGQILLALAVFIGQTRLIDNMVVEVP